MAEVPRNAGRVTASASRGTEWEIPSPILIRGQNSSIGTFLDPVGRYVDVPRSVLHLGEKFCRVGFDAMLSPIKGTTIENGVPGVPVEDASSHFHGPNGSQLRPARPLTPRRGDVPQCRMWVVPEGVEMPQVWHLPLEEARVALDAVGIPHRISFAQSQTIPDGELLSVAPPTGATVAPGMEALLVVSSGPPVIPHQD
jgi:hypothetical protein